MLQHIRACLWLLVLTIILCCVIYPLVLLGVGQALFRDKANGSLVVDEEGHPVGSRLIAQPFQGNEYFQPRPSSASYNAAASGASNWAANNYMLRERVARTLGPIVKYRSGPKKGKLVGEDIEDWFREEEEKIQEQRKAKPGEDIPGLVAQWADAHNGAAAAWVKADPLNSHYVAEWQAPGYQDAVADWKEHNSATPEPKPEDLAVVFFKSFSRKFPGKFPSPVPYTDKDGKEKKRIEPVAKSSDIQSDIQAYFFDMWRQAKPTEDLADVPADLVMASGSGLDPHITLKNAVDYQLDRVAEEWAKKTRGNPAVIRKEIEDLLNRKAEAPLGGVAGVKLINVLEMNLALRDLYGARVVPATK
jgi:K+-transporting ATPase ATPase C chain